MIETVPRIEVSFGPSCELASCADFVLEELTFNPFISVQSLAGDTTPVDMWMEFVIRNKGTREARVPNLLLQTNEQLHEDDAPTCRLPHFTSGGSSALRDDMNFVMHSDIWYSFVRLANRDREFMSKGYNQPIRLLYSCRKCAGNSDALHVTTEEWATINNHVFNSPAYWQGQASELLAMMKQFNEDVIHSQADTILWEDSEVEIGNKPFKVRYLRSRESYSHVCFEKPLSEPRARFAVRRLPWKIPEEKAVDQLHTLYEPSYGGTAKIDVSPNGFRIYPLLFPTGCQTSQEAVLRPNAAVRFWIRWRSRSALEFDIPRDRFRFAYIVNIHPTIRQFNTFFRVPEGFDCLPGSATELKHYPVPPRLFFVWEQRKIRPDQCFSGTRWIDKNNTEIELFTEFFDKTEETKRLIRLFVLGVAINILAGAWLSALYYVSKDRDSLVEALHLRISPLIALLFVVLAAVLSYRRFRVRWLGLAFLVALSMFFVALLHKAAWLAILGVVGLAWWTFPLPKWARIRLNTRALGRTIETYLQKRRY